MKKTVFAVMAVAALMAYGQVFPLAHAATAPKPVTIGVAPTGQDLQSGASQEMGKAQSQEMSTSQKEMGTPQKKAGRDMAKGESITMKRESITMKSCGAAYDLRPFLDKDIAGTSGEKLGTVKDFVADPAGHVFAIISTDTGKTVAVPFESFATQRVVSLDLNKEQLAGAPEFNMASVDKRDWSQDVYRQFGIQPSWSGQEKAGAYESGSSRDMAKREGITMRSCGGAYNLKPFLDKDIAGTSGEKLGTIKDFVADPAGHVFAIISTADKEKTVAVPFESFVSQRMVSLDLNKDQLAGAPEFNMASVDKRDWSQDVYRQFGIQPSWSGQEKTGQ